MSVLDVSERTSDKPIVRIGHCSQPSADPGAGFVDGCRPEKYTRRPITSTGDEGALSPMALLDIHCIGTRCRVRER
jgi:hypothetical protein